jgi:NTE family protein
MKIALALSGGGFRATVYHLGVMARLAEDKALEDVSLISTVSGGSLCTGLVYALNHFAWPNSTDYLNQIVPEARRLITTFDLQSALILRVLRRFWTAFETRADDLSSLLQKHWNITARLSDLPPRPRWMINSACYESGKNWRFERWRMGDYVFGYSNDTQLPLSDALAASAGFPGLVGALKLKTTDRKWYRYASDVTEETAIMAQAGPETAKTVPIDPPCPAVHLWDGGVYDNHGLQGLMDNDTGWRAGIDFLIVSDAAGRPKTDANGQQIMAPYRPGYRALLQLSTGIMMNQVRSLRTRAVIERFKNHQDQGVFLQTGSTCRGALQRAKKDPADITRLCADTLSADKAREVAEMATNISQLKPDTFEQVFRHGFEVADYTLYAYYGDQFKYIGYANSRWCKK